MNYEFKSQQAKQEEDMERRFNDILSEMKTDCRFWGISAMQAVGHFELYEAMLEIACYWHDEAEIGRRMKEQLSLAIDIVLEDD